MGLDINAVQFLLAARKAGVDFGEVLMLGRQDLNVFPTTMVQVLSRNGFPTELFLPGAPDLGYADPCFYALGAKKVLSMDVSEYEGANFVHDLNLPIQPSLKEKFDLVYDGGTLEHVFDFPTGLRNCMEMVRPGGRLFLHTVANNYCGHGFYQFSPELFFTVLSPENGFDLERMVLHSMGPYGRWYEVSDPKTIQSRVELINCVPMQLLIRAKRSAVRPVLARPVQQSDFAPLWHGAPAPNSASRAEVSPGAMDTRSRFFGRFPGPARLLNVVKIGLGFLKTHTTRNRRSFRRIRRGT